MILYYITDRRQFQGSAAAQRRRVLEKIAAAARAGVDTIQLREKDLGARELERLAAAAVAAVREAHRAGSATCLLINSRGDVALATGADGVHLPADDISPDDVRAIWGSSTRNQKLETRNCLLGVSCHSLVEVERAESQGADFAVFGPVFGKQGTGTQGTEELRRVCQRPQARMPVLALGGVTVENAGECLRAGAAGVAGIRLFQTSDVQETVRELRRIR